MGCFHITKSKGQNGSGDKKDTDLCPPVPPLE